MVELICALISYTLTWLMIGMLIGAYYVNRTIERKLPRHCNKFLNIYNGNRSRKCDNRRIEEIIELANKLNIELGE